jgi:uncharacterized protein
MPQSASEPLTSRSAELADLDRARAYALGRLERELPPALCYHSLHHTRDDVVVAIDRLAAAEGVTGEDLLLLRTAAYFHDLGFIEQREQHEAISARFAAEMLPRFGYQPAQIELIAQIIMVTRLPQSPSTLLEQIMADADLDVCGREDFLARNQCLRAELASIGIASTDREWYADQLRFLQLHRYWTAAARAARDTQKQANIAAITQLLAQSHA